MRKILLFILFIVLLTAAIYKSPFSAMYNYNKAKALYSQGEYEDSLPYFERSLFADRKGILARFYYVLALSKSEPTYTVQKKLYQMSESDINDEATKYAKSQIGIMKHKLIKSFENNYIYNAAMGNDIVRWDIHSFPLNVYIETSDVPQYYYSAIKSAFNQWVNKTNFIKFNYVNDKSNAQIIVSFKDISDDICDSRGNCRYIVAYTEPSISNDKNLKRMNLKFYKTNPLKQKFSQGEIYNTAQHEIGHTLGIMGHSDNPSDIMYAKSDTSTFDYAISSSRYISRRDLNTLIMLYRIEPTIMDKKVKNETLYYAPLIIGKDDVVLQRKLEEYSKYIKNYPNLATGYINISSVYVDMGNFDLALKNLNTAKTLAKSVDEKYIIEYDLAIIYYNKQEPQKALEHAKRAQEIKPSDNADELISDIEKLQTK